MVDNRGCGFASWGEALRRWRIVLALLIVSTLAACQVVGEFIENSPAHQTMTVREVSAAETRMTPGAYPTPAPYPTRTPGPTLTPVPPSNDARVEYYRGIYDVCVSSILSDPAIVQSGRLQSVEQVYDYCNGYAGSLAGWYDGGSTGFVP